MSADIWLESADGDRLAEEGVNVTYNLSEMLAEAGMGRWSDYIGMSATEAAGRWEVTLDTLRSDPERFRKMNPPNGWGTYNGAMTALGSLVDICHDHPKAKIGGWL